MSFENCISTLNIIQKSESPFCLCSSLLILSSSPWRRSLWPETCRENPTHRSALCVCVCVCVCTHSPSVSVLCILCASLTLLLLSRFSRVWLCATPYPWFRKIPQVQATKPVHNYWACALEPGSHNSWAHGAEPKTAQPKNWLKKKKKLPQSDRVSHFLLQVSSSLTSILW